METLEKRPSLSVIIPCYNEEDVLPETISRVKNKLSELKRENLISDESFIYFVDDGSTDKTWSLIEQIIKETDLVRGIKLSRNYGHQNALLAGLFNAEGDVFISIDADLQDDINIFSDMLCCYGKGAEIVYGVRSDRKKDTIFKKNSAELFYKILRTMGVDIVFNHADYRLMSSRAIAELKAFNEVNLFLRGIIPLLGFRYDIVEYQRKERFAGESKYPLHKMLALAWNGISSFSNFPLRLISWMGFFVFFMSVVMSGWVLFVKIFTESAIPGWASNVLPVFFLGGVQILSIGVIGEYLAKLYMEVKKRPRFIVEKKRTHNS